MNDRSNFLSAYLFAIACCLLVEVSRAEPPAVVATDVPVTVGQTMQNDASLADVTFVDRNTGWAVGDRGVIWHTADGGKTWQLQASGVTCRLTSVCFLNQSRGWAAGGAMRPYSQSSHGVLLVTNDGGATWNQVEQATLPTISRLKFFDAVHGIAAGGSSACIRPECLRRAMAAKRGRRSLRMPAASGWLRTSPTLKPAPWPERPATLAR